MHTLQNYLYCHRKHGMIKGSWSRLNGCAGWRYHLCAGLVWCEHTSLPRHFLLQKIPVFICKLQTERKSSQKFNRNFIQITQMKIFRIDFGKAHCKFVLQCAFSLSIPNSSLPFPCSKKNSTLKIQGGSAPFFRNTKTFHAHFSPLSTPLPPGKKYRLEKRISISPLTSQETF